MEFKAKGLKSKDATNWMTAMVTLATILLTVVSCMIFYQLFKNGSRCLGTNKFNVEIGTVVLSVAILVVMSSTVNWQIGVVLRVTDRIMELSYFEAVGFLGITDRTRYIIEKLDKYELSDSGITIWGKIKYNAQMERSKYVNKISVDCKFTDRDYIEKFLETLVKLGGEVTPSRLDEVTKRIGVLHPEDEKVFEKSEQIREQEEKLKEYAKEDEKCKESVEKEEKNTEDNKEFNPSDEELEQMIEKYKQDKHNSESEQEWVLTEQDMHTLKRRADYLKSQENK